MIKNKKQRGVIASKETADRVRYAIKDCGHSIQSYAKQIVISRTVLSNFINRSHPTDPYIAEKICKSLNIPFKIQSTESEDEFQGPNLVNMSTIASWIDRQQKELDNLYSLETLDNDRIRVALENLKLLIEIRQITP